MKQEISEKFYNNLELFMTGQLSDQEKKDFQKEISASKAKQEFYSLIKSIDAFGDEDQWMEADFAKSKIDEIKSRFQAQDTVEFATKLKNFRSKDVSKNVEKQVNWSRFMKFGAVAASIVMLLYVFTGSDQSLIAYYNQNNSWTEIPSVQVKGDAHESTLLEMENNFKAKKYHQVLGDFDNYVAQLDGNRIHPNAYIYQGLSFLELGENDKSIASFNQLLSSNTLDNHKAYWYLTLVYLKIEDKENALKTLKLLTSKESNYNYDKANKLLKSIG